DAQQAGIDQADHAAAFGIHRRRTAAVAERVGIHRQLAVAAEVQAATRARPGGIGRHLVALEQCAIRVVHGVFARAVGKQDRRTADDRDRAAALARAVADEARR